MCISDKLDSRSSPIVDLSRISRVLFPFKDLSLVAHHTDIVSQILMMMMMMMYIAGYKSRFVMAVTTLRQMRQMPHTEIDFFIQKFYF